MVNSDQATLGVSESEHDVILDRRKGIVVESISGRRLRAATASGAATTS
jgi:hypothetical protein